MLAGCRPPQPLPEGIVDAEVTDRHRPGRWTHPP
jgi:hypothetical protein